MRWRQVLSWDAFLKGIVIQILLFAPSGKFLDIILHYSSLIIHLKADPSEMLKGADCGQIFI